LNIVWKLKGRRWWRKEQRSTVYNKGSSVGKVL
jgi:hypothetical protein